jgi:hypothetical protein
MLPLEEALAQILEAFDADLSPQKLPTPAVRSKDRPAQNWLLAALQEDLPKNPFPKGGRLHREAEALRAFLAAPPGEQTARLKVLPLTLVGSQAALWRWGQTQARRGELQQALRHAWEDCLLAEGRAMIVRGWALRHAFCFALAEADENRFAGLRAACREEVPELVQQFQRAFALLGGPPPRIYLWSLPDLEALDLPLGRLGSRLYIAPLEPGAPAAPEGCTWIIPCMHSNLATGLSVLEGESLEEACRLADQTRSLGRKVYLAPSREPLEACALAYFPIDIRLDAAGLIRSIRMGDAALAK